jgi:glycolate oxidase FAD binding subunit
VTEEELVDTVREAHARGDALRIRGGDTKTFYGRIALGGPVSTAGHTGIVAYEPTELVITACAGTPLAELEAVLARERQMLAFEPPWFGSGATLGGTVACGLSGPRRPYTGSVRDFVLGVKCINGVGEVLRFGGQVMKNVAGFDVSRLMAGALGTLGLLLEVSLKVLPRPDVELTLERPATEAQAIAWFNQWAGQPLPLSAACYFDGRLRVRLSGAASAVVATRERIGGDAVPEDAAFWRGLREHTLPFFTDERPLWRLSLRPATPPVAEFAAIIDWGGAQRWVKSESPADEVMTIARRHGGHASLFRGGDRDGEVFTPLPSALDAIHRRLKAAFDPKGILNPGRMYSFL